MKPFPFGIKPFLLGMDTVILCWVENMQLHFPALCNTIPTAKGRDRGTGGTERERQTETDRDKDRVPQVQKKI